MNQEAVLNQKLQQLASELPTFSDGRIDYTNASTALVLVAFVRCHDEILIVKRSHQVIAYKGLWGGLGGYIDEPKPIQEKVIEELVQELGLKEHLIENITVFPPFENVDQKISKTWLIYPILVDLSQKPDIVLDWEHVDHAWIKPHTIFDYEYTPNTISLLENMDLLPHR